jgi:hypothetical protein
MITPADELKAGVLKNNHEPYRVKIRPTLHDAGRRGRTARVGAKAAAGLS